jgi:hypothetical protein
MIPVEFNARRTAASEARFLARLAELGATPLYVEWRGSRTPHAVLCASGHNNNPTPVNVFSGHGVCKSCAGKAATRHLANAAEIAFLARLAELGATPLYDIWLGANSSHSIRCANGHESSPRPGNVAHGSGICERCYHRIDETEATFRARLAELGATPLYTEWKGTHYHHAIRCAAGHERAIRPAEVLSGRGPCRTCKGKVWDVFYVVTNPTNGHVKFGITSGNPCTRLDTHKRYGYTKMIRLFTNLPGTNAPDTERAAISALKLAGIKPVRGREHFPPESLPVVLDIVDHYLEKDLAA